VKTGQRDGPAAARQPDAVGDLGHRADARVGVVVARKQQYAILVAHVDGQGDRHAREDDHVLEGHEQQCAQNLTLPPSSKQIIRCRKCT
jgi:hypothetical protein